jgi:hypothetical protein
LVFSALLRAFALAFRVLLWMTSIPMLVHVDRDLGVVPPRALVDREVDELIFAVESLVRPIAERAVFL